MTRTTIVAVGMLALSVLASGQEYESWKDFMADGGITGAERRAARAEREVWHATAHEGQPVWPSKCVLNGGPGRRFLVPCVVLHDPAPDAGTKDGGR